MVGALGLSPGYTTAVRSAGIVGNQVALTENNIATTSQGALAFNNLM